MTKLFLSLALLSVSLSAAQAVAPKKPCCKSATGAALCCPDTCCNAAAGCCKADCGKPCPSTCKAKHD